MTYANPTSMRLGTTGDLGGQHFRVAGRVVMGTEVDGETCYWNEFRLVDEGGGFDATLVYEETEDGAQWRLFTLFEPLHPLTVAEAAGKKAGDTVTLDDQPMPVTLVDRSRVYFIEGTPPEGVEVGDEADYFNLENDNRMMVVSWTGDEIEFYQGITLDAGEATKAFNLPAPPRLAHGLAASQSLPADDDGTSSSGGILKMIVVLVVAVASYFSFQPSRSRSLRPLVKPPPPAAILPTGATGVLGGQRFTVTGCSIVEIARVGSRYDQVEYELADSEGGRALLVCGFNNKSSEWHLFRPVSPAVPLTPGEAASKCAGNGVTLDGHEKKVQHLFRSRWLNPSGTSKGSPGFSR